jgi:hypothetical protein
LPISPDHQVDVANVIGLPAEVHWEPLIAATGPEPGLHLTEELLSAKVEASDVQVPVPGVAPVELLLPSSHPGDQPIPMARRVEAADDGLALDPLDAVLPVSEAAQESLGCREVSPAAAGRSSRRAAPKQP